MRGASTLVVALFASACAYHAPAGPTPVTPDLTSPAALRLSAAPGVGAAATTAAVTATVLTAGGAPLADVLINFSADVGTLSAAEARTDAAGAARVTLTGPAGPATVTARAGALVSTTLVALQPAPIVPDFPPSTPPPPQVIPAPIIVLAPVTATVGVPVLLQASPLLGGGRAASFAWQFGDGTSATTGSSAAMHTYDQVGALTARVTVTTADGRTATTTAPVSVGAAPIPPPPPVTPPPSLAATLACVAAAPGSPTACNVTATYGNAPVPSAAVTRVDWDWGDGQVSANGGVARAHNYGQAGTFTVLASVTAATADGTRTAAAQRTVTVVVP